MTSPVPSLLAEIEALLAASAADPAFAADVLAYANGRSAARVRVLRPVPRVKVLRVLAQLLATEPRLRVCEVQVDARSGCADLRGALLVACAEGQHAWRFVWDCRWQAEQLGWRDRWGFVDQERAARERGWRCFARWEALADVATAPASVGRSGIEERP